jgi:glycosyltransferase involved in cell wall biosynthesis
MTSPQHRWLCFARIPPPRDGQTLLTQELLTELSPEFHFITANASSASPGGLVHAPGRFRWQRLAEMTRYLMDIRRLTARYPFPILYAILSGNQLGHLRDCLAFRVAIPPRRPVVAWTHNSLHGLAIHPLWRHTLRSLLQRIRYVVVAGRRLAEPLAEMLPEERIVIIPNVAPRHMLCTREEVERKIAAETPLSELRILFVAHMLPEKGGWRLLEAASYLHQAGIPFRLTYAGGWTRPEDAQAFAQRVHELGLSHTVTHHGTVNDPTFLRRLYLEHHIYALPTNHPLEAQPITVIEALSAGCAVVSTNHATIPDMVHDGVNGFLVSPHPQDIAAALARYWREPGLWHLHAHAARSVFEGSFSPELIRNRWRELLLQVEREYSRYGSATWSTP